jgi:glycosyltransferase involved in cell wall biosynthesis
MSSIIFMGFTVPDNVISKILESDPNMPIQTHKFAWSFVEALSCNGVDVECISSDPVSNFPLYHQRFFKSHKYFSKNLNIKTISFINIIILKHLSRFFSSFLELFKRRYLNKTIIIHGIHTPFLLSAFISKLLFKFKVVVILTDPAGVFNRHDTDFTKLLKRIDKRIVLYLLDKMDGSITLTDSLFTDYMPNRPNLLVEGIVSSNSNSVIRLDRTSNITFAYTGGLYEKYGVKNLVDAVISIGDPKIRLKIFGLGDLNEYISSLARKSELVSYYGFVSPDNLIDNLSDVNVLVNPRPVDLDFIKYSFPSKLLEYMCAGVCVLTSRLPTIPSGYDDYLIYLDDTSVEGIKRKMIELSTIKIGDLDLLGSAARNYVLSDKSSAVQGKRIKAFLNSL